MTFAPHLCAKSCVERFLEEGDTLVEREHRLLVLWVADDADHDAVEDRRSPADHVDVPVRHGVIGTGVNRSDHASKRVMRAAP